MSIYENFPYQDVDNLNLDWILKKVKEVSFIAETYNDRLQAVEDALPTKEDLIIGTNINGRIVVGTGSKAKYSATNIADVFSTNANTDNAQDDELVAFYNDPDEGLQLERGHVKYTEITKKAPAETFTGDGGAIVVSNGDGTVTASSVSVTDVVVDSDISDVVRAGNSLAYADLLVATDVNGKINSVPIDYNQVLTNGPIQSGADGDPIVSDGAGGIKVGTEKKIYQHSILITDANDSLNVTITLLSKTQSAAITTVASLITFIESMSYSETGQYISCSGALKSSSQNYMVCGLRTTTGPTIRFYCINVSTLGQVSINGTSLTDFANADVYDKVIEL